MKTEHIAQTDALPLVVSIEEACGLLRSGRSAIYEMISSGRLEALKLGRKTVVLHASIVTLIETAPRLGPGNTVKVGGAA